MRKFFLGRKRPEHYNGLLIKADLGLHEQVAEIIREKVPVGGHVLDLGAGEGALASRLVDMGYRVTAADKDQESFKCAGAEFSRVDFDSPEEIERFVSSRECVFDAVMGVEVIEHVQDQWEYVRQLVRMLKPGGMVLVTTPNTTSWLSRFTFLRSGRFHQFADHDLAYGHISPITPWELNLVMRAAGILDIRLQRGGTLPPIYFTGVNGTLVANLASLLVRPFMKGIVDGWCIIASGKKPV